MRTETASNKLHEKLLLQSKRCCTQNLRAVVHACRPHDSTAGVSTACTSIAICGKGLSRSPSSCSSATGHGTAIGATVLALSGSRAATPHQHGPSPCSPTTGPATPAAAAMLLLHSSSSGSRAAALSPLHTGSRPLLPGGHFLPAMPQSHSPSAVQLSGQGSPSAAAARHRPTSAVLPFKCPSEDRMGQCGGTGAGTGDSTHHHQTQLHQLPASSACAARLNPLLVPLPPPSQRSRSSIGSGTASPCPITRVGGNLDCERSSVGSSSLLSGDSSRAHDSGTSVRGSLDCGGGSVSGSSLLSGGSILLRGSSSRSLSLASHSPATSHNGDASFHLSISLPVDALPHPAPHLLPYTQLETPPIDVVSGDAHAPAAAVGEIGAAGAAAAAAAAAVGAEAAGAGVAGARASASAAAAAPAAVGPAQSSGRWTQLEAALTMATPPAPWQHTPARPPSQPHVPSACTHSPPGSPSPGLAHSRAEPFHAHQLGLQQEQPQPQQPRQQPQQQGQQGQQRVLCDQRCEGQQGQARHGSSRGSSRGTSRDGNNAACCSGASESTEAAGLPLASGATAGGADAPCSAGAGESIEATGVLQANMAMAACSADVDSTDGDAGGRTQPVIAIATAAEGQLQQQPQVSEDHGGKGRTQLGSVAVTEEQSPGVGEEGQTEAATLTKKQPQRRPQDGELDVLQPQADEAGEESDAEAEGRVVEAEKRGEEVDGAVGRKKKKKRKAKAGKRALKANGSNGSNASNASNASNVSAGSTACGGLSNSSSRCGGSRGSNVLGGVGDVASGVGCGSRGSNVLRGVGDGSRGSSRGASAPAVADAQGGRHGCASTCSSGSGSARAGDSGKRATVPLQGPPNGPLSSNTGGPISIVGQGPSANLANPMGRAGPSPDAVKGRSMSTGRGCGVLQRTAGLDGSSHTLRHRGGGALHTASSSVHCSPARTSRRSPASSMHLQGSSPSPFGGRGGVSSPASSTMPLPPLAATQLPSRNFQDHSAFHTSVASVTSRFGPGEALVARSGGNSGGRGSVTGVMSQAEGEVAGREALDLREERRKAHERLEAYSKAKQAKAQEVRGSWGEGGGGGRGRTWWRQW